MENILKKTTNRKNYFIKYILDELINTEIINEEEYKLAICKTNFKLIQKHCKHNIKSFTEPILYFYFFDIDEIIDCLEFDVAGFMNEIKNK